MISYLGMTVNGEHIPSYSKPLQMKFAAAAWANYVSAFQTYSHTNKLMFQNDGNSKGHLWNKYFSQSCLGNVESHCGCWRSSRLSTYQSILQDLLSFTLVMFAVLYANFPAKQKLIPYSSSHSLRLRYSPEHAGRGFFSTWFRSIRIPSHW